MTPLARSLIKLDAYEQTKNPEYMKEVRAIIQSVDERVDYRGYVKANNK